MKAIVDMPAPANVKELQQVRGIVNYIGIYIPNLATMMLNGLGDQCEIRHLLK